MENISRTYKSLSKKGKERIKIINSCYINN